MSRLLNPVRSVTALAAVVAIAVIASLTGPATAVRSQDRAIDYSSGNSQGTLISRVSGETGSGKAVRGTYTPHSFHVSKSGNLISTGVLSGKIEDKGSFSKQVSMRVNRINGSRVVSDSARTGAARANCEILDLVINPISLDLLGLKVNLDRVHLNITAQSGSGNLLGNLLCAVAGLLDGGLGGLLDQVAALLNQILGRLNL